MVMNRIREQMLPPTGKVRRRPSIFMIGWAMKERYDDAAGDIMTAQYVRAAVSEPHMTAMGSKEEYKRR